MHFYPHRRYITFFKLSSDVALDESGLSDTTIADKNHLEGGDVGSRSSHRTGRAGAGSRFEDEESVGRRSRAQS